MPTGTSAISLNFLALLANVQLTAGKSLEFLRVSMGLTVSRKTAKNLAVRRKNERILTVSRKKMLTVKKF